MTVCGVWLVSGLGMGSRSWHPCGAAVAYQLGTWRVDRHCRNVAWPASTRSKAASLLENSHTVIVYSVAGLIVVMVVESVAMSVPISVPMS